MPITESHEQPVPALGAIYTKRWNNYKLLCRAQLGGPMAAGPSNNPCNGLRVRLLHSRIPQAIVEE